MYYRIVLYSIVYIHLVSSYIIILYYIILIIVLCIIPCYSMFSSLVGCEQAANRCRPQSLRHCHGGGLGVTFLTRPPRPLSLPALSLPLPLSLAPSPSPSLSLSFSFSLSLSEKAVANCRDISSKLSEPWSTSWGLGAWYRCSRLHGGALRGARLVLSLF